MAEGDEVQGPLVCALEIVDADGAVPVLEVAVVDDDKEGAPLLELFEEGLVAELDGKDRAQLIRVDQPQGLLGAAHGAHGYHDGRVSLAMH